MTKYILFLTILSLLMGCGVKSEIRNPQASIPLSEAYKEGINPIFAISDLAPIESPVKDAGLVAGGLAKLIMNLGAKMGYGKKRMTLSQRLPEIPSNYLADARIKRVFFYIEPTDGEKRDSGFLKNILYGKGTVNFSFLSKLAIKIKAEQPQDTSSWIPVFKEVPLDEKVTKSFLNFFTGGMKSFHEMYDEKGSKDEILLLKYDDNDRDSYLNNDRGGVIYIINSKDSAKTKNFFVDHPRLQGAFKNTLIMDHSLMLELHKDVVVEENFNTVISETEEEQKALGMQKPEACTKRTCLDLRIPNVNLIPILMNNKQGITLDAFVEADKIPESFKLKGFVEFKMKLQNI